MYQIEYSSVHKQRLHKCAQQMQNVQSIFKIQKAETTTSMAIKMWNIEWTGLYIIWYPPTDGLHAPCIRLYTNTKHIVIFIFISIWKIQINRLHCTDHSPFTYAIGKCTHNTHTWVHICKKKNRKKKKKKKKTYEDCDRQCNNHPHSQLMAIFVN